MRVSILPDCAICQSVARYVQAALEPWATSAQGLQYPPMPGALPSTVAFTVALLHNGRRRAYLRWEKQTYARSLVIHPWISSCMDSSLGTSTSDAEVRLSRLVSDIKVGVGRRLRTAPTLAAELACATTLWLASRHRIQVSTYPDPSHSDF